MEAKKKDGGNPITHGCIIAKATVIIPDVMLPNPNYVINNPMLNSRSVIGEKVLKACVFTHSRALPIFVWLELEIFLNYY